MLTSFPSLVVNVLYMKYIFFMFTNKTHIANQTRSPFYPHFGSLIFQLYLYIFCQTQTEPSNVISEDYDNYFLGLHMLAGILSPNSDRTFHLQKCI